MSMNWLKSPITCEGEVICDPLSPEALSDTDLPEICFRMGLIMESIERGRCDGRLLPRELFDSIDRLEDRLRHHSVNRLADWINVITQFGSYYGLVGDEPIEVSRSSCHEFAERFKTIRGV